MVTRVRIEAQGESAGEVERHIGALASAICLLVGEVEHENVPVDLGQMVIQREEGEPAGYTAFSGRGLLYLNVASDAPQVDWLKEQTGSCSVLLMNDPFAPVKGIRQTALQPIQEAQRPVGEVS